VGANGVDADAGEAIREGLSSVTRGTLYLLVATLCLVGLNFGSRVIVVRSISPSDWSAFSFGLTLAGLLATWGTLGLPSAVARSIPYASSDAERRTIVRGTLWIGSATALGVSAVLWVFATDIGRALGSAAIGTGLQYFPVAVATSTLASLIGSIFQGYEDVTPNAFFVQIVNPALFVGFLGIAIVLPPFGIDYPQALLTYALANVVTLALLIVYSWRRLPRWLPPGPTAPEALGRLLRFAAPLFVVGIMASISGAGDTLILGIYHEGEVGTYTASLTLSRLLPIGIGAAAYIFLPVASKFLRRGDKASIGVTYVTVTKWMLLFSLPLFLLFEFLPSDSLGFVYGANYTAVIVPLQVTVLGAFVVTVLGPATTAQVVYGQTRLLAYNAIVAGATDFGLSLGLIPTYGEAGAAVAWTAANVVYGALSLAEIAALSRIHPFHRHLVVPVLGTALPVGAALILLRPSLSNPALVGLGVGIAALFVLLVLATRSIDEGDRLLLEAVESLLGRPLPFLRRLGRFALREHR
jgi:O-antigen/teichoic acid export membrane protein